MNRECTSWDLVCIEQESPASRIECLESWDGAGVITIEIEGTINVLESSHTISPGSVEHLSPTKPVPGAKKVGDRWHRGHLRYFSISLLWQFKMRTWESLAAPPIGGVVTGRSLSNAGGCDVWCCFSSPSAVTDKIGTLPPGTVPLVMFGVWNPALFILRSPAPGPVCG